MEKVWLAVCLSGALAVGCGDDSDGQVAASKQVGELSQSEAENFCGEVEQTFTRLQKIVTTIMCTEHARDEASTCSNVRTSCIDDPPFDVDVHEKIDFECDGTASGITHVCPDIKVGELRACIDGLLDSLEKSANQFTCTSDLSSLQKPTVPDACHTLGQRCASLSGFSFD